YMLALVAAISPLRVAQASSGSDCPSKLAVSTVKSKYAGSMRKNTTSNGSPPSNCAVNKPSWRPSSNFSHGGSASKAQCGGGGGACCATPGCGGTSAFLMAVSPSCASEGMPSAQAGT